MATRSFVFTNKLCTFSSVQSSDGIIYRKSLENITPTSQVTEVLRTYLGWGLKSYGNHCDHLSVIQNQKKHREPSYIVSLRPLPFSASSSQLSLCDMNVEVSMDQPPLPFNIWCFWYGMRHRFPTFHKLHTHTYIRAYL